MSTLTTIRSELPNGAKLLAIHSNIYGYGVVLAETDRDYVTWRFYRHDLNSTANGNYFVKDHYDNPATALKAAEDDFKERTTDLI